MDCKNCGNEFEGKFCNYCGQKAKVDRIDLKYLITELPNGIFQANRGFLYTIKELSTRPGHSIREYIEGKRIKHYKPIAFLLITSTLYVLAAYLLEHNTFVDDIIAGMQQHMKDSNQNPDLPIFSNIKKFQAYIPLLVLPVFAFASYIAFIRSKYNYFEHLVLNVFITAQQMIIYLFLGSIFFGEENPLTIIPTLVGMIYNYWAYHQFFKDKKISTKIGLILLSYLLFIVICAVSIFLLGFLTAILGNQIG